MDPPDLVSVAESEATNSRSRKNTPVQHHPLRLDSGSPASSSVVEVASRKRKRPSEPLDFNVGTGPLAQPRPSRPPEDDRTDERLSKISKPKRLIMDCVLITKLPPRPRRQPVPPEPSEDEGARSQARAVARNREKRRGKRREVISTSRASVLSDSRSLAGDSMRSQSHSVSSIRPPLFEPVSLQSFWYRLWLNPLLGN